MAKRGPKPKSLADRFWPKVKVGAPHECWEWHGCRDQHGYGQIGNGEGSKHVKTHRVSWFLKHGEWPTLHVLHKCDNPSCVNPDHLFLGTQKDNHDDMKAKRRGNIGMRHGHHKLTDAEVIAIRECGKRPSDLADEYGVSQTVISAIQLGQAWQHLGGPIRGKMKPGPRGN